MRSELTATCSRFCSSSSLPSGPHLASRRPSLPPLPLVSSSSHSLATLTPWNLSSPSTGYVSMNLLRTLCWVFALTLIHPLHPTSGTCFLRKLFLLPSLGQVPLLCSPLFAQHPLHMVMSLSAAISPIGLEAPDVSLFLLSS